MTLPTSDIVIKLDGVDITNKVVYKESSFTSQANPIAGSFNLVLEDKDQDFDVTAGEKVQLWIDGVPLFGGYVMSIGRSNFFPAVDTKNVAPNAIKTRKWILQGPDFNILFDKRVIRNDQDFDKAPKVPKGKRTITKAFRHLMNNYIDVPAGLNYHKDVDWITTQYGSDKHGGLYVGLGSTWREQMDDFADNGAIVYYIDGAFSLHMHEYEVQRPSWLFSDKYFPAATNVVNFREGEFTEDFTGIVTEALVWGGSSLAKPGEDLETSEGIGVVFAKYPDGVANTATWHGRKQTKAKEEEAIGRLNKYGRWQMAEMNIGQDNYLTKGSVKNRAYVIINGPPGEVPTMGIQGGFNRPLPTMRCKWYAHDVPNFDHIRPGYITDFILYTQGTSLNKPLVSTMPLRSMTITFPSIPGDNPTNENISWVMFEGEFGLSFSDSRHMWRALNRIRRKVGKNARQISSNITVDSENATPGSTATLEPNESPDGSRTEFTFPYTFYQDNIEIYLNGLRQRRSYDYIYSATDGTLTFSTAPARGDNIWAEGMVSE